MSGGSQGWEAFLPADTVSAWAIAATVSPAASEAGKTPLDVLAAPSGAVEASAMARVLLRSVPSWRRCAEL